jgi:hypothetical protein
MSYEHVTLEDLRWLVNSDKSQSKTAEERVAEYLAENRGCSDRDAVVAVYNEIRARIALATHNHSGR